MKKNGQCLPAKTWLKLFVIMKEKFAVLKNYKKEKQNYMLNGAGNYILEFKFNENWWGDATKEDGSVGHLINHSKSFKNIKPVLKFEPGKPIIKFISFR